MKLVDLISLKPLCPHRLEAGIKLKLGDGWIKILCTTCNASRRWPIDPNKPDALSDDQLVALAEVAAIKS